MSAVTVLGLGTMGAALAKALRQAENEVVVWNRTPGKAPQLDKLDIRRANSTFEAALASPVIVVCLLDDHSVSEVLTPMASELRGRVVVNLTSSTPDQARTKARWASAHGVTYLDGGIMAVPPMIGTPAAMVLYSGDASAFAERKALLEAFGRAQFVGADPGRAALVDLSLLVAMYGMLGGFLHAAVMAESGGVKVTELASLAVPWLNGMAGTLPEMAHQIDARRFADNVGSNLAMQAAGMATIVEASQAAGVDAGLMLVVQRWMRLAVEAGHGGEDLGRLVDVLHQH